MLFCTNNDNEKLENLHLYTSFKLGIQFVGKYFVLLAFYSFRRIHDGAWLCSLIKFPNVPYCFKFSAIL